MTRSFALTFAATLLALACSGCDHSRQAATETSSAPVAAPVASSTAASSVSATVPPPPPPPAAEPAPTTTAEAKPAPAPPTAAPIPSNDAEVPRSTITDVDTLRKAGAVTMVDVRDDASYAASHIPGALHIPLGNIAERASELPRDKPIVTYCA